MFEIHILLLFEVDEQVMRLDEIVVHFERHLDDDDIDSEVMVVIDEVDDEVIIVVFDEVESLSDEIDAFFIVFDEVDEDEVELDDLENHLFIDVYLVIVEEVVIIFEVIDDRLLWAI